jgi:WD40 repeat protein
MASKGRPRWAAGLKIFAEFSHEASVNALALEPTERHIFYSGCGDEHVRVWDLRENGRDCKHRFEGGHTGYVSSLLLVDEYLMSASFDRTIVLWNTHRRDVAPNPYIFEIIRSCAHTCGYLVTGGAANYCTRTRSERPLLPRLRCTGVSIMGRNCAIVGPQD